MSQRLALNAPALAVTSRVVAVVGLGYAATVGLVTLLSVVLVLLFGMVRSEAIMLLSMIGFLGFAGIIIWGFAESRLVRIWAILSGVAIISHGAALALAPLMPVIAKGG